MTMELLISLFKRSSSDDTVVSFQDMWPALDSPRPTTPQPFDLARHLYPRPADILELIDANGNRQWALYEGSGKVIYVSEEALDGRDGAMCTVERERLIDVAKTKFVRVNNKEFSAFMRRRTPLPVADTLAIAGDLVEHMVPYSKLNRNSEHYVTNWKYGVWWNDGHPKLTAGKLFVEAGKLDPLPGDLVEFRRDNYFHWGFHVGGGKVVHVCNLSRGSDLVACGKALIRLESLVGIARGDHVRVNNQEARAAKSWIPQPSFAAIGELIAKVRELVGMEVYYSLPSKNCEHYVTEWRYGKAWSVQVENLWRMSS